MTEILTISPPSEANFGSTGSRRSCSHTSLLYQNHSQYSRSNLKSGTYVHTSAIYETKAPASLPSSAPSSPRFQHPDFSNLPSYLSTPSSSLSLDEHYDLEDDAILFPSYEDPPEDAEPPPSPALSDIEDLDVSPPREQLNPERLDTTLSAADDIAAKIEPSRHVDYLSHDWKEEDIWSSWRHIVGKRNAYRQRPYLERASWTRLENASWRTWAKSMNRLNTVTPERLNWMKDHDVTWLYGPLQPGRSQHLSADYGHSTSSLSRTNSFATKKPILKKRSLSELMLQRSLSSATLMKQAVDALRAQQPVEGICLRPALGPRAYSDYVSTFPLGTPAAASTPSAQASSSSSGLQTPSERRHIHFNDKVEQCIAINKEADDEYSAIHEDSDSDDGILMMKPMHEKARKPRGRNEMPRGSFSNESKTIAMLPSTTLRGTTPELPELDVKQPSGGLWNAAARLVTSPSQETLKPSKPSTNFLLDDEDDEADMTWQPAASSSWRNGSAPYSGQSQDNGSTYDEDDEMEGRGLRRTPSGMFMPYEDDEDEVVATGLFGKVVDTVNTAKDIAHVIWNVGWRR